MTEEEEFIFEDDSGEEEDFIQQEDENENGDYTPLEYYQYAKEHVDVDNDIAIDNFYAVYSNPDADTELRMKSLCKASVLQTKTGNIDSIIEWVVEIFKSFRENELSASKTEKTINSMLQNIIGNEDLSNEFIQKTIDLIDRNALTNLFLMLRLRQCETEMKNQKYFNGREILEDILSYVVLPPNTDDPAMCQIAVRSLIIRIQLADFDGDEEAMLKDYEMVKGIPNCNFTDIQNGILKKIEGLISLKKGNPKDAYQKYYDAFCLLEISGNDSRVFCLNNAALCQMLISDNCSILYSPEAIYFKTNPAVAPLECLAEKFNSKNVVEFCEHIQSAQTALGNRKFYNEIIDQIRKKVLLESIIKVCMEHSSVEIKYISKVLQSDINEVRQSIQNLILIKKLNALIDYQKDIVIMNDIPQSSIFISNILSIVETMENNIKRKIIFN